MTFSAQRQANSPVAHEESRRSIDTIKLLAQQAYTTACDLLFPPVCIGCERVGSFLCDRCRAQIHYAPKRSIESVNDLVVRACYEGVVREAIHAFKFNNLRRLADPLVVLLDEVVTTQDWTVDLVTAVPMHASRLHERGYNQAALLGQGLAKQHGWMFSSAAVRRDRATRSQVKLNVEERRANVTGAFSADPHLVAGRRVLIVDDVLTTGATLGACADALWMAGAAQVLGAVIASPASIHDDVDTG